MKLLPPRETYAWLRALWERRRVLRISRETLLAEQNEKFRKLVVHAYTRSPFYRAIIDQRGLDLDTCTPVDFPVLTKTDVIEQFDRIVTDRCLSRARIARFLEQSHDPLELFEGRYHVLHTSGTSGTVGYFVYSHDAWIKGTSQMVRALPLGLRTRVAYVAAIRGHFAGASLVLTANHGTNNLFYDVRTYDVGQPMGKTIDALNEFQPQTLSGYAGVLKSLAEAQEEGRLQIRPTMLASGAETLRPEVRDCLERVFGVPVVNAYASSEHLFMALTLPGSDGMYLLEDDLIYELHDDHSCVTNLFNEAMPLIRYRMDDVLVPAFDPDSHYPFTKIQDLVGRSEDTLVFKNCDGADEFIHPCVIAELFVPGMNAWQIVVLDRTSFVFRARFEPGATAAEKQMIRSRIREKMSAILAEKRMDNVTFEIEEVDALPLDPISGKFRLVLKPPANARRVREDSPAPMSVVPIG